MEKERRKKQKKGKKVIGVGCQKKTKQTTTALIRDDIGRGETGGRRTKAGKNASNSGCGDQVLRGVSNFISKGGEGVRVSRGVGNVTHEKATGRKIRLMKLSGGLVEGKNGERNGTTTKRGRKCTLGRSGTSEKVRGGPKN